MPGEGMLGVFLECFVYVIVLRSISCPQVFSCQRFGPKSQKRPTGLHVLALVGSLCGVANLARYLLWG